MQASLCKQWLLRCAGSLRWAIAQVTQDWFFVPRSSPPPPSFLFSPLVIFPSSARTQGRFAGRDRRPISSHVGSRRPGLLLDRRQFHSAQVSLGLAEEAWESAGALTGLPGWRQKARWRTPADTCRLFAMFIWAGIRRSGETWHSVQHLSQTKHNFKWFLTVFFFFFCILQYAGNLCKNVIF